MVFPRCCGIKNICLVSFVSVVVSHALLRDKKIAVDRNFYFRKHYLYPHETLSLEDKKYARCRISPVKSLWFAEKEISLTTSLVEIQKLVTNTSFCLPTKLAVNEFSLCIMFLFHVIISVKSFNLLVVHGFLGMEKRRACDRLTRF